MYVRVRKEGILGETDAQARSRNHRAYDHWNHSPHNSRNKARLLHHTVLQILRSLKKGEEGGISIIIFFLNS